MQKSDTETISNNNKNSYTCIGIKVIKNGIIDVNNTTGRFRGKACVIVGCKRNQFSVYISTWKHQMNILFVVAEKILQEDSNIYMYHTAGYFVGLTSL